uniref:Hydantoinase_A domain-containing protein n=1 Tax=Macrostomum lignano TaxID=282301 RepID=A0A1I8JR28_9PLAT
VSLSHRVMQMVRAVPRGHTACADAYLTPCIDKYIGGFASGFAGGLKVGQGFNGSRAILSGPAGGVVGYALTTHRQAAVRQSLAFDMGGTSTDVSRFDGQLEHVFETTTAGVAIQAPQLDINTVAAGGGSRLFFSAPLFVVGPDPRVGGAHPGPVCYRKGGPLTPSRMPTWCWAGCSRISFRRSFGPTALIRHWTQRGQGHALACFGGAGGQHACAIARSLGMIRVFCAQVLRHPQRLRPRAGRCVVHEAQEPCAMEYRQVGERFASVLCPYNLASIEKRFQHLEGECLAKLTQQGFDKPHWWACASRLGLESDPDVIFCIDGFYGDALSGRVHNRNEVQLDLLRGFVVDDGDELGYEHDDEGIFGRVSATTRESKGSRSSSSESLSCIRYERYLHLRYDGTDCAVMCRGSTEPNEDYLSVFVHRYRTEFGFTLDDRRVLIDDIAFEALLRLVPMRKPLQTRSLAARVHHRPSVVLEQNQPYWWSRIGQSSLTKTADLLNQSQISRRRRLRQRRQPIAESELSQMGRVLPENQHLVLTSRERLDFSCALFGPDGRA